MSNIHESHHHDADEETSEEMRAEQKRHDQLTTAPNATEGDAAPRIETTEHDGRKRIDVADDAPVRPGPGPEASSGSEDA